MSNDEVMRPVAGLWQTAAPIMLGNTAPREAQVAGRRFFYAGALCLLDLQEKLADLEPAQRHELERALREELRVFFATQGSVVEGLV